MFLCGKNESRSGMDPRDPTIAVKTTNCYSATITNAQTKIENWIKLTYLVLFISPVIGRR